MNGKVVIRAFFTLLIFAGLAGGSFAQDINKAQEAFNKALELQTSDPQGAINEVKACIDICDQIGEDADDLKMRAELKLPELYINVGNKYARAKKLTAAIPAYQEAIKVAQQYDVPKVEKQAIGMLPKLYYSVGGGHYKKGEFEDAIAAMNKAIEVDPDYAKAYYTIGLVHKKNDNLDAFESIMEKGLVAATKSRDNNYKKRIAQTGASTFLAEGAKLVQEGKASEALPLFEKALKFEQDNADVYFYQATSFIETKQWDKAVDAANKGLAVEKDAPESKAKHYYNLGLALKGKGDTSGACAAMKNALHGQFKENAQYEIEHSLKCG